MSRTALIHMAGTCGDHNDRAMQGSPILVTELEHQIGGPARRVGSPATALNSLWDVELQAAHQNLADLRDVLDEAMTAGVFPVTASSRCSAGLATLPVIAKHHPDAVVVWFDAHAGLNTPDSSASGFLGGMAVSSPLGWWDSGFGEGIPAEQVVLAGVRDIGPPELTMITEHGIPVVPPGPDFARRLSEAVAGRPVYVHVDCDVLEPGTVSTDYVVGNGLTLDHLHAGLTVLADGDVVGIQIAEFESGEDQETTAHAASQVVRAIRPVLPVFGV